MDFLREYALLSRDALLSRAWVYPILGVTYLVSHPNLYSALTPILTKAVLTSVSITGGLFFFTYLPQVAFCALFSGPLAFITAALLVMSESYVLVSVVSKAFFLNAAQDRIFDAVLLQLGKQQLVEKGRQVSSNSSGFKVLGRSLTKPLNYFSKEGIVRYILSLPLNSIPGVGTIFFLVYNGVKAGPGFHARYFQLKNYDRTTRESFVESRKGAYTAFGATALALNLVPVVGLLFNITSTIGAALWANKLEESDASSAGSGRHVDNVGQSAGDVSLEDKSTCSNIDCKLLWDAMSERKEIDAFFNFFATFDLTRPVSSVADLADGAALFEVLSVVDPTYFRQPSRPSAQPSENWVLRFSALKRLYRLMTQYFADVLQKPTSSLDVPDLQAIAKDHNLAATLTMCRLTIVIGVQCEKNKEFIDKIQGLSETDQHHLMKAIEQVMAKIAVAPAQDLIEANMTEDDHYYRIQSERSQIFSEKETLEKVYQALLEEHRALQTAHDDVISEKEEAQAQLRQLRREADSRRNEKADVMMRTEMDRLRAELQKSEDNLAMAESELDKHTNIITELTRKVDELQVKADEAEKLKDKVDEYRHAADKLQKTENVMEKYKKKLQEGADLRQHVKALEKQNADLVDKNASLEEEFRKVSAFKPLMESYKNQILELESKNSARSQEIDTLNFELEQCRAKLKITLTERAKDAEALELYQERVRELELSSTSRARGVTGSGLKSPGMDQGESTTLSSELNPDGSPNVGTDIDGEDTATQGLGGELDDAITGTTMTDLKLQIRKLQRELEAVKKNEADASRVLVLENLLEDANRMKARYENDYLAAHREKLVLQRDLEEIRSGKSMGDGTEAAIALRQRLNETVELYEALRKEHAELEVQFETLSRELTIAKSDLTLVNKDQLDILASLRESVNEDKAGLEADLERLRKTNKELSEKNRMQLEQINGLLLEKVNLQSEGIGHREKLLQRERDFGDLRASLAGKDLPEDVKQKLLAMHEENVNLKESLKTAQDKLAKAKQFIKQQDKLFKEQHAATVATASQGTFEEAEASFRSQIKVLEEDLARQKRLMHESTRRYRREQELMLSAIHAMGMKTARQHLRNPPRIEKTSFLGMERNRNPYAVQSNIGGRS